MKKNFPRRLFLAETGAIIGFPALVLSCAAQDTSPTQRSDKSRVVTTRKDAILGQNNQLDFAAISSLIDKSICSLSDKKDPLDLWRSLFSPSDTVGIKLNTLGGRMLSPHPELVEVIAERLVQAGVSPNRILIWDRSEKELARAGFPPGDFKGKAKVIATDSQGIGLENELQTSGAIGSCFSRIISTLCTALINIGMLKDHDLAGTSVAMKNHFGVIHNPNRYHIDINKESFIPDLCLHPYIKNKLRLTIADGLIAQFEGGPVYKSQRAWPYSGILISRDQVALDSIAADIIEKKRKEQKLPSLKEVGRDPLYIQFAEEKKLGWADPAKIDLKEVVG